MRPASITGARRESLHSAMLLLKFATHRDGETPRT